MAEVIDARIPVSSRNPDLDELVGEKPRLIVLNRPIRPSCGDEGLVRLVSGAGMAVLETNARDGKGVNQFSITIKNAMKEKLEQWKAKGMVGRPTG